MRAIRLTALLWLFPIFLFGCDSASEDPGVLLKEDLVIGTGDEVQPYDTVMISYEGRLEDGTLIDRTVDHIYPYIFTVGGRQVIEGLELGMEKLRVGGSRRLTIPPGLAFGRSGRCTDDGNCPVPPSATVIFDVTLDQIIREVIIEDVAVGTGLQAKSGDRLQVHYIGELRDGNVFDTSYSRGAPFSFTLGTGQVIAGWDQGIAGMRVGGERKLIVPPQQAYGSRSAGASILPYSTLFFTVELIQVVEQ